MTNQSTPSSKPLVRVMETSGSIVSNSTITIPFTIDNLSDALIDVGLNDTSAAQARLETASGTIVVPDQTTPIGFSFPGTTLVPGNYRVVLTTGTLSTTPNYFVRVTGKSSLTASTKLIPPTAGSTTGKIEVTLDNNGVGVTGATVTAAISTYADNGTITNLPLVTLVDDGTNGDTVAGDGKYTALLPSGLNSELVTTKIVASGSVSGTPFTRSVFEITKARSGEIRFNGLYNWQGFSNSVAGATSDVDIIYLNIGVNVQQSGTYRLEATLAATDGTGTSKAITTITLAPGTNIVQLKFDGLQLWKQQANGPYSVTSLTAYLVNGQSLKEADGVNNVSVIPQLNLTSTQLHREPLRINGTLTNAGINPDTNGKFQTLQVTVPLDVALTNTYAYSAILRTQTGTLVGEVQAQTSLSSGTTTPLLLNFNGSSIFATAQNGPYSVVDLVVKDHNTNQVLFYVPSLGQTSAYQYADFAGGTSPLVVTSSTDG